MQFILIVVIIVRKETIMEILENKFGRKSIKCPKCGSNIEVTEGYVEWCEHCLWNLNSRQEESYKTNIFERMYSNMGRKLGKEIFQSLVKSGSIKPTMNVSKVLALIISCSVYCVSIISIVLMVFMIRNFGISIGSISLSLVLLCIAVLTLPRFGKLPKNIISRSEYPALYKLVDDITKSLNSKDIYGIVINERFNASYTEVGIKRRKIVYIGLPLFYILNDEEKVALLSHEIAHGINGDVTRGLVTSTAINTLITWYKIVFPKRNIRFRKGYVYLLSEITDLIMLILSKIVLLIIIILVHVVYNDSQRAEYLADYIGASISGTNAMKSLLDKLNLDNTFRIALQKSALSNGNINFFHELLTQVNLVPNKELERIHLVERLKGSSLHSTHPPTAYRISLIDQTDNFSPKVRLSNNDSLLIEKEIKQIRNNIERELLDGYKAALYY